jgi:homoserine dehydrogenase
LFVWFETAPARFGGGFKFLTVKIMTQKINIVLFGIGKTGSALINKFQKNRKELLIDGKLDFRFPVITNSTVAFYEKEGGTFAWEANFIQFGVPFKMEDVYNYIYESSLENLIAVDATASDALIKEYSRLLHNGFTIVSANPSAKNNVFDGELPVNKTADEVAGALYRGVLGVVEKKNAA